MDQQPQQPVNPEPQPASVPAAAPTQPQPPQVEGSAVPPTAPTSGGKATAALVLGICGLVAWIIPLIGLPVTIVGLVLAVKGLKQHKKFAKAAMILAIIGLVASIANFAVGAYMGATGQHSIVNQLMQSDSGAYPEETRSTFVDSCVSSGGAQSDCECTFNEIEQNMTYEEFAQADSQAASGGELSDKYEQVIADAVQTCVSAEAPADQTPSSI